MPSTCAAERPLASMREMGSEEEDAYVGCRMGEEGGEDGVGYPRSGEYCWITRPE